MKASTKLNATHLILSTRGPAKLAPS